MDNAQQVPQGTPAPTPVPLQTEESPKQTSKRSPLFKILLVSMGILFVFVAAELVYYFKFATPQNNQQAEIPALIPSPVENSNSQESPAPQPAPTPPPFVSKTIYFDKEQKLLSLAHSFADKSDMITSFDLSLGVVGQVVGNTAEEYDKDNTHYVWRLGLTNNQVQELIIFRFTTDELKNIKVTRVIPSGKQQIKLEDISEGEIVEVKETDNFLDSKRESNIELRVW